MDHVRTATDSACLFLRIRRNIKHKPIHLLILPNCVLRKKTKKKELNLPKRSSLFFLMLEIGLLFSCSFFYQILRSSARRSRTAIICMSLERTALANVEAAFCVVVCCGESFGLKIETAGVLKIGFGSLHLVAWLG